MSVIVRVGIGYDLHRLEHGARMVMCGVEIPCRMGLVGHSDADVVLHAVIDALLGAAGLDDIGEQFPDSDPACKDADSSQLLLTALELVRQQGYSPVNVDITVIAETPKLSEHKSTMRQRLAGLLGLDESAVGIKAKTNEGIGSIGTTQAIACHAIVSLTNQ